MPARPPSPRPARAFTLVELMISTTLLALVLLVVSSLIANTTSAARRVDQLTEMDREARGLFDAIASDLAAAQPVDAIPLALLAASAGGTQDGLLLTNSTRPLSGLPEWQDARLALVAYSPPTQPATTARRSMRPLSWLQSPFPSAPDLFSDLATSLAGPDTPSQALGADLASSVVRLSIVVHTTDGRVLPLGHPDLDPARHPDNRSLLLAQPSWHAITITIALVPPATLANFIEAGGDPAALAAALPDPVVDQLPRAAWDPSSSPTLAAALAATWPQAAANLQAFQRTFPLRP